VETLVAQVRQILGQAEAQHPHNLSIYLLVVLAL
jgi:hypothetical protein